jgi:ADP-glucose pyrophosphorylase
MKNMVQQQALISYSSCVLILSIAIILWNQIKDGSHLNNAIVKEKLQVGEQVGVREKNAIGH